MGLLLVGTGVLLSAGLGRAADVQLPPQSPIASVTQQVGITTIRVVYARAALGRRELLSTAATAGSLWLPGEAATPRITFTREVDFLGVPVPAGTYTLLAVPGPWTWTMMLNRDTYLTSTARYRAELDVARGEAAVETGAPRERMEMTFADFNDDGGVLQLAWGGLRVEMPIRVHTREQIQEALGALDQGWRWYADAAEYMLNVRRDYDAGLRFAEQSIALQRNDRNTQLRAALVEARDRRPRQTSLADTRFAKVPLGREMRRELRPARLSLAREDTESRVFHTTIEAATTGALGDERVVTRPEVAARPPSGAAIAAVIRRGRGELQSCYQRALRKDPSMTRARVRITINVGTSGMVKQITTDPGSPPAALDACIQDSVTHWAFPRSSADYQAVLPLSVRAKD
ncbi:MAG TPA: DUF2911 domain-containing protein [Polyangia bacterium]|nr:DUF2911 domain-containing protein [Polyangia bacterium]